MRLFTNVVLGLRIRGLNLGLFFWFGLGLEYIMVCDLTLVCVTRQKKRVNNSAPGSWMIYTTLKVQHASVTLHAFQYNLNLKKDTTYVPQNLNNDVGIYKTRKKRIFTGYALDLGFIGGYADRNQVEVLW